jgi:glycosyltransferase involved in cell wall biosynthesis
MEISVGILDYSLENIKRIRGLGIQNTSTYYLPIGADTKFSFDPALTKDYDFVFYGDYYSSERRKKLIQALQTRYQVLILQDIFEKELYQAITRAKAVINLHYYENPLLETTRLCECLSLGMPVLSEATMDNDAYPEFSPAVRYFKEGSVDDLMDKAQWFLDNLPSAQLIHSAALASEEKFNTHFDQAFIALKLLPINQSRKTIAKYFKMLQR